MVIFNQFLILERHGAGFLTYLFLRGDISTKWDSTTTGQCGKEEDLCESVRNVKAAVLNYAQGCCKIGNKRRRGNKTEPFACKKE